MGGERLTKRGTMEEDQSVEVEATTEESQPEVNTEEAEASEDTSSEETATDEVSETAEAEPEAPKRTSRATERIRELVAQKKALEAQLQKQTTQLEGVDETGIDPERFAKSVAQQSRETAASSAKAELEYYKAETSFPLVKDNAMVRSRASVLVDEGYLPTQAAEIATLEWNEATGQNAEKSAQRKEASVKMRQNSQIPSAGKAVATSDTFSRSEIDKMSPQDYVKNASAIQAQLEKYGPESFE